MTMKLLDYSDFHLTQSTKRFDVLLNWQVQIIKIEPFEYMNNNEYLLLFIFRIVFIVSHAVQISVVGSDNAEDHFIFLAQLKTAVPTSF